MDVVTTEEARTLAEGNPYSFLRVIRSEIELDSDSKPEDIYKRASDNLRQFTSEGILIREQVPSLYIYQLEQNGHIQSGIVGCCSLDDYDAGLIKIHEKTRPDKENDRKLHMLELKAQPGPLILAYRDKVLISALVDKEVQASPLYEFSAEDGVVHRLWKVQDSSAITQAFSKIPQLYIADGHHRAASASKCRQTLREQNPSHNGSENYNYFLTVLFPDTSLQIFPYNRIVRKTEKSPQTILEELSAEYQVSENGSPEPKQKEDVCLYLSGSWYYLSPKSKGATSENPVDALDVSLLRQKALTPIFGIEDERRDKNVDFIGGIRGTAELERLVDSGKAVCAFSLYPVSMDELLNVADQQLLMAPKSTWFEPKLRSGLLVHEF